MTVKQAGRYLNIKPAKVHQLIRVGVLTGGPTSGPVSSLSVYDYQERLRLSAAQTKEIIREHNRTIGTRTYPQPSRRRAHLNPMAAVLMAALTQQAHPAT